MDRVEILKETPEVAEWKIKVRKVNKTRAIVGNIVFHVPFGLDLLTEIKLLKKQGGEYRYLPYGQSKVPFCEVFRTDVYVYPDLAKNSDFPAPSEITCPIPAKNYTLYGVTTNLENAPKMAMHSGEYAVEIYYFQNDIDISCYRIYAFVNNIA